MHKSLLPLVVSLMLGGLLLSGCLPESKNPLSTPGNSLVDPKLEGAYAQVSGDRKEDPGYWHFHFRGVRVKNVEEPRKTPALEIVSVEPAKDGGIKTNRYAALATELGGNRYLSFVSLPEGGAKERLPYSFARYDFNWRGDLQVWIANNKAFAEAITAGKLRGKVTRGKFGDTVSITDSTERLAAFVAAGDPKALFSEKPLQMRRIGR